MTTSTSPVVMVAVHDGFYGCGAGAGQSNRAFLRMLAPSVRLAVLPVRLRPGSSEYDPAWHRETLAILARTSSEIVPVDNGSNGMTRFGGLNCFRNACTSATTSITRILAHPFPALIVAFDVPFFGLAPLLPPHARAALVNVARATAPEQKPRATSTALQKRQSSCSP